MKIDFTPSGGAEVTLGDDGVKHTIVIEQLGGSALEQVDPIMFAANASRIPRGNVSGDFVFTASKSHATLALALTALAAEYARLNAQGSLECIEGAVTLTMANAVLRSVQVSMAGVRLHVRYTFGITTIT